MQVHPFVTLVIGLLGIGCGVHLVAQSSYLLGKRTTLSELSVVVEEEVLPELEEQEEKLTKKENTAVVVKHEPVADP